MSETFEGFRTEREALIAIDPRYGQSGVDFIATSRHKPKHQKAIVSESLRWDVWERDNFTCQHCGTRRFLSVDHILPESKGGPTTLENLQTLCRACNSRKHDHALDGAK